MSAAATATLAVLRSGDVDAAQRLILQTTPLTWPQSFGTLAWTLTAYLTPSETPPPPELSAGLRMIDEMRGTTTEAMTAVKAALIAAAVINPDGAVEVASQLVAIAWEVDRQTGGALTATYARLCDAAEVITEAEQVISEAARAAESGS